MRDLFQKVLKFVNRKPNKKYSVKTISKEGSIFEVDCWILSEILLDRVIPKIGISPYPLNEQMLMAAAVAYVQPKIIIEWGTHVGISARLFWEVKEALGLNCHIYTIDSMNQSHPEFPGAARGKYLSSTDVKQIVGDGAETANKLLEDVFESVLVYVDGDHSRESVKRDLAIWDKLPQGSGILAHDVFYQTPSTYNVGPWQSFQELLQAQKSNISQVQWQLLGLPGMAFVSKK
jgi:predicted O-methyltransferase YrrM